MIRKFAGHDCVSPPGTVVNTGKPPPPGCVQYEKPFVQAVEEYNEELSQKAQESIQKALQAAYDRGLKAGYLEGVENARRRFMEEGQKARRPLDPDSEEAR